MDPDEFIVATYCLVDDLMEELLGGRRLRERGPASLLDNREILTIEIVGEFLGMDTDKAIFEFFRHHYAEWFPAPGRVHRTTFTRGRLPTSGPSSDASGEACWTPACDTIGASAWWTPSPWECALSPRPRATRASRAPKVSA